MPMRPDVEDLISPPRKVVLLRFKSFAVVAFARTLGGGADNRELLKSGVKCAIVTSFPDLLSFYSSFD